MQVLNGTMAKQAESHNVLEPQCSGAAKELAEQKRRNHEVVLKLRRSIYLVKNHLPHSTTIELQVVNGDKLLERHINEGPANAHTSAFSANTLVEAIDTA